MAGSGGSCRRAAKPDRLQSVLCSRRFSSGDGSPSMALPVSLAVQNAGRSSRSVQRGVEPSDVSEARRSVIARRYSNRLIALLPWGAHNAFVGAYLP